MRKQCEPIPLAVGQVFGDWTVVDSAPHIRINAGGQVTQFKCRCVCGNERFVDAHPMRIGRSKSCGCRRKRLIRGDNHSFRGIGDLSKTYFSRVQKHAKERGHEFELTLEEAWHKLQSQHGTCALSGVPIDLGWSVREITASLDRIDSSKGYIPQNVQWVHKDLNKMKNNFPESHFIEMCGSVYLKSRET